MIASLNSVDGADLKKEIEQVNEELDFVEPVE
jgi:hypothetical protein